MGTKISALGAIVTVSPTDVFPIVDVSDNTQGAGGSTKKITITQLETRLSSDGFLSSGDNISALVNDSGYITSAPFNDGGEAGGANRDLGNTDAFGLSFITSGVGRINILSTGEVGIGTSVPSEKLEVVGNVTLSLGGNRMSIGAAIDSVTGLFIKTNGSHAIKTENTAGTRKGLSVTNADGRVGIGWDTSGPYKFIVVNDHSATSIARFYDNGASNLILDISETGQVKIGGTVSNTKAILDIKNFTKALHLPTLSTVTRDGLATVSSDAGLFIFNDTEKKLNFYNGTAWTGTGIYAGSGTLSAATTITNAGLDLAFMGTGNLGLGTLTPSEKLEVVGNAKISTKLTIDGGDALQCSSLNGRITIGTTLSSINHIFVRGTRSSLMDLGDATTSKFSVDANGQTIINHTLGSGTAFRIDRSGETFAFTFRSDDGNVGIGVGNTPSTKLQVGGGVTMNSTTELSKVLPITAAQASLVTPANGNFCYVTTIDGTFTSIGFWKYENAAWAAW